MSRDVGPSLTDIEPCRGMKIVPYVRCGTTSRPLGACEAPVLDADDTRRLIDYLIANERVALIEAYLQGGHSTADDEKQLTAIIGADDCRYLCNALDLINYRVVMATWMEDGCNEVALHFRDCR